MLIRRLLDGERVDHDGPALHDARRDVRAATDPGAPADPHRRRRAEEDAADGRRAGRRLEQLRVARGDPRRPRNARAPLRRCRPRHRHDRTDVSFHIILRDDADAARARTEELLAHNGVVARRLRSGPWPGRRRRSPTSSGRTATLGFRRSSCGCPRRSTARRSSACPRWARSSTDEGRPARRRRRRREARPGPRRARRRGPDGRRQHRRRPGAPRALDLARPRHGGVHPGRARRRGPRVGAPRRDLDRMDGTLRRSARTSWFRLGDRDLATHLWRTDRLRTGTRPTDVARDLRRPRRRARRSCR